MATWSNQAALFVKGHNKHVHIILVSILTLEHLPKNGIDWLFPWGNTPSHNFKSAQWVSCIFRSFSITTIEHFYADLSSIPTIAAQFIYKQSRPLAIFESKSRKYHIIQNFNIVLAIVLVSKLELPYPWGVAFALITRKCAHDFMAYCASSWFLAI